MNPSQRTTRLAGISVKTRNILTGNRFGCIYRFMPSITLKNIPEHLHLTYKRRAKRHARSLQAEILHTLDQSAGAAFETNPLSVEEVAGCIQPKKRQVSLSDMDRAVDSMFKKKWTQKP